jgi:hypothetical protein
VIAGVGSSPPRSLGRIPASTIEPYFHGKESPVMTCSSRTQEGMRHPWLNIDCFVPKAVVLRLDSASPYRACGYTARLPM